MEEPTPPSSRDLVRRRSRRYEPPDPTRMHHIGAAPDLVPVHTPDGVRMTRTTPWQLADRTDAQLVALLEELGRQMTATADVLDFEQAAYLRDERAAVEAEQQRRR